MTHPLSDVDARARGVGVQGCHSTHYMRSPLSTRSLVPGAHKAAGDHEAAGNHGVPATLWGARNPWIVDPSPYSIAATRKVAGAHRGPLRCGDAGCAELALLLATRTPSFDSSQQMGDAKNRPQTAKCDPTTRRDISLTPFGPMPVRVPAKGGPLSDHCLALCLPLAHPGACQVPLRLPLCRASTTRGPQWCARRMVNPKTSAEDSDLAEESRGLQSKSAS